MSERPLTICAIGNGRSVHVAVRTRCFAERGNRVFLLTDSPSEEEIPGVTQVVLRLPSSAVARFTLRLADRAFRVFGLSVSHLARGLALAGAIRRCRADVVHVHFAYNYHGWLAGLLGCRPLAVTVMGGDILFEEQGNPTPAGKFLTLFLLHQADYITSKSDYLITVLDRLGGFGRKAERIIWGVSLSAFRRMNADDLRAQLGIGPDRRVVLSPKILQRFYRIDRIVEAMAHVARAVPHALLLVTEYGADPAYRSEIQARIQELGLQDHVKFCGHVSYSQMPRFYNVAEMTVAVPSSDGLPQTLLEGMACEVPSVLGKLPRYLEIVEHRRSALFVDDDPRSIAEGIVELYQSPDLRATIARNALAIVKSQANLEEQAARVEERFRRLVRSVPRRIWRPSNAWSAWKAWRRASSQADLAR